MEDPKFQVYSNGKEYRYLLRAKDGRIILHGGGYLSEQACLRYIGYVKANAPYYGRYERKTSGSKYYFILKSRNKEIIGISEKYGSARERDEVAEEVLRDAPEAPVEYSDQE